MAGCAVGLGSQKITRLPPAWWSDPVNVSENSSGRTIGIYFDFIFFKWQTQDLQRSLCVRLDEIQHFGSVYDEELRETGHHAYSAVENVVTELLTIEHGTARIDRGDKGMAVKLHVDSVVEGFCCLCELGRQIAWNFGAKATICMAGGDNATRFVFTLETGMRALETQRASLRSARIEREKSLRLFQAFEGEMRLQIYRARDAASSRKNRSLAFFSRSTRERLQRDVEEADQRLHKNLDQQRVASNHIEALQRLEIFHQQTWARMGELRDKVQSVAGGFKLECKRVLGVQQVKDKVFENLLNLRNKIQDPEFGRTRDSSLRLVVELCRADDDSWCGYGCVRVFEENIIEAISTRRLEGEEEVVAKLKPVIDASDV